MAQDRTPLSRERIAKTALDLGDAEGLDALSMRKVGAELGVEAMSLYNHVKNKDDLLDSIGDILYGEILERYRFDEDANWRDNARSLVDIFFDVTMAHPNLASILLDRPIPSATKMLFLTQCYNVFLQAGYPVKEAALAFNTVAGWMTGVVRSEMTVMRQLHEQGVPFAREDVPEEFHGTIEFMECCTAWSAEQRFTAGFETIMTGLEKELADQAWSS